MRKDMDKVTVERPRRGSKDKEVRKGYYRNLNRIPLEDQPKREGIHALKGKTKELSEHLNPLIRYLHKQVGKSWDSVYSDICENIRLDSAVQSHVRDHVDMEVNTKVSLVDGKLISHGYAGPMPLFPGDLYVCPETGILKKVAGKKEKYKYRKSQGVGVIKDENHQYHKIDGVWYELELRDIINDPKKFIYCVDVAYNITKSNSWDTFTKSYKLWSFGKLESLYGKNAYAVSKKQLSSRDIKKLKLNEYKEAA